jgi:hypothetical protein
MIDVNFCDLSCLIMVITESACPLLVSFLHCGVHVFLFLSPKASTILIFEGRILFQKTKEKK